MSKWKVRRTREEQPCEQFEIVGRRRDWSTALYQYADTRAEADAIAREANESGRSPDEAAS